MRAKRAPKTRPKPSKIEARDVPGSQNVAKEHPRPVKRQPRVPKKCPRDAQEGPGVAPECPKAGQVTFKRAPNPSRITPQTNFGDNLCGKLCWTGAKNDFVSFRNDFVSFASQCDKRVMRKMFEKT